MIDDTYCESEMRRLQEKIEELECRLNEAEESLRVGQRRYEIAVGLSDVTIFDYNIKTKKILTQPEDFEIFGMPGVLEEGIEEVLASGIIAERSKNDIKELYRKIDCGAANASARIYAIDRNGMERTLDLQMVAIYDKDGKPTYAVGVRKDITDMIQYRKEKEYSDLLSAELTFVYEANVTRDRLLGINPKWAHELGLDGITTLAQMMEILCKSYIAPEDVEMFISKQSREAVLASFARGERIVTFEYRSKTGGNGCTWFEARVNLVGEDNGGDVSMRVYILNIDGKKKNEMRMVAEHKRYEMTISKSVLIYELNVTQDNMSYLRNEIKDRYEFFEGEHFTEEVLPKVLNAIHPRERDSIEEMFSRSRLLEAYALGETNLSSEYRRIDKKGIYNWFRCSLQFMSDPQTNDIMCEVYIEDIDAEKKKERDLLYRAQHDMMTGFYNRSTAREKTNEFLSSEEGRDGTHVFFIIDIDYFKQVNDTFGHTFGDTVLAQTAAKIGQLFRTGDVFGRIGGDEFVVFMKNAWNDRLASLKAQELCDSVSEMYTCNGIKRRVTVSVGVAIYNKHGTTFDELYRCSDAALYEAKEQGRNRFSIYREGMQMSSAVNAIDMQM